MASKTLTMLSHTEESLLVEVEVDESVCVIRAGDRHHIKTFTGSTQSQVRTPLMNLSDQYGLGPDGFRCK